jgi:DNA-binding NarL/FixJ family response regulator
LRGRLNKQIAGDLEIHERTVKVHRRAIMTKLRVKVRGGPGAAEPGCRLAGPILNRCRQAALSSAYRRGQ